MGRRPERRRSATLALGLADSCGGTSRRSPDQAARLLAARAAHDSRCQALCREIERRAKEVPILPSTLVLRAEARDAAVCAGQPGASGRGGASRRAGVFASSSWTGRQVGPADATRPGPLARSRGKPPSRPRDDQSHLAARFRPGNRRDGQQLRHSDAGTRPSRSAGLVGRRFCKAVVEYQVDPPRDRLLRDVPAKLATKARIGIDRCREPSLRAAAPLAR